MNEQSGYTFLECLLTLMLLIILFTMGGAAYQHLIARNKTSVYLNELVTAIYYARSEALKQRSPVTICKSATGRTCSGDWRDGWIVFINPLNQTQPESMQQILRNYQALPKDDQLVWRASLQKNDSLQFNALGNARQDGTFTYCPHNHAQYAGAVTISLTGRVRVEKTTIDKTICTKNSEIV